MERFAATGWMDLSGCVEEVRRDFAARAVSEDETIATIRQVYQEHEYLLDPHTAVGVKAALELKENRPVVCLATAHPAKFGDAVRKAIGKEVELPPALAGLSQLESRCELMDADAALIREHLRKNALL
jgi:threonine synthase